MSLYSFINELQYRDLPEHTRYLVSTGFLDIIGVLAGARNNETTDSIRNYAADHYPASRLSSPVWYPGQFQAFFQSKSSTVALATAIVLEEMERIRQTPVSEQELATVQAAFIETFPRQFESKQAMVGRFIEDEWTGRDPSYYATIRDRVRAVTLEDIMRVAHEHLHPDRAVILVVGDWEAIAPGDLEGRASMAQFGEPTELPLRDPMTMEPMGQ